MQDGLRDLGPYTDAQAVTPHATNPIPVTDAIMVNVAGNVVCRFIGSNADVTLALLAGVVYHLAVTNVRATSTATGIFALYN
jgi:hypothetical protein